jgi:hypothetical protein
VITARCGGNNDCDRESGQARGRGIDTEALRRRYRLERDKRLRPDGNDQYLRLTRALAFGKHFGLYHDALFHPEVTGLRWDEAGSRWISQGPGVMQAALLT